MGPRPPPAHAQSPMATPMPHPPPVAVDTSTTMSSRGQLSISTQWGRGNKDAVAATPGPVVCGGGASVKDD